MLSLDISSKIQGHSDFQNKVLAALNLKRFTEQGTLTQPKPGYVDDANPTTEERAIVTAWELLKRRIDHFASIYRSGTGGVPIAELAYTDVMSHLVATEKLTNENTASKTVVEIIDEIHDTDIKEGVNAHWLTKL
jgi:hypothetical protein